MKLSIKFILLTMTILMSNLASGNESIGKPTAIVVQRQIATQSAQVRVKIQKPKIFVGHPRKVIAVANGWDDDFLEIDDLITSYRRRDLNKIEHEDGISDKIRWRLFLARQLALLKYRELHG